MPKQKGKTKRGSAPYSRGGRKGTRTSSTMPTPPMETRQKSNRGHSTPQQARQSDQGRSGNSQTAGRLATGPLNTKAQLPLTREDIPVLVQQVLRALPESSTSVPAHTSTADDPPPSLQNNSASIEEDPPQLPSEL